MQYTAILKFNELDHSCSVLCDNERPMATFRTHGHAEMVAHCLNVHNEMLEALKLIQKYMAGENGRRPLTWDIHGQINSAVSKAEGK